jgi:hypothetical protein
MGRGIGIRWRLPAAEHFLTQLRPLRQPSGNGLNFDLADGTA